MPSDRELALQRFFALTPNDQLATYRVIRDHLAGRVHETNRDRLVGERAAALDAFATVAKHLKLQPGQAPTPNEFDAVARTLGVRWNRSRVRRAWGRWRFARDAFLGTRLSESAAKRDHRLRHEGRKRHYATVLEGLQWWLVSGPKSESRSSYTAWAKEFNGTRADHQLPVLTDPGGITNLLDMKWPDVVRFARGEIGASEGAPMERRAPRERVCRGPFDLVGRREVGEILGQNPYGLGRELSSPMFPRAVVVHPVTSLWIRSDVEAYQRDEPFPERVENELRHLYLTRPEVAELTNLRLSTVIRSHRGVPAPAVSMGRLLLWLRSEVEEALEQKAQGGRRK